MSKYLDKAKELRAIVTPHYNCAQSVIVPFAEDAGVDTETAMTMGANFGGGMRVAGICGAITGGLMTLGLYGVDDPKIV
ncbi:MAG: C_GCAxxG_C_C family protein, partial [Lachnospiraceae bacterium]|nr:C_GCAxxG_C_C family protein [Lachnospiraceae bacterium]